VSASERHYVEPEGDLSTTNQNYLMRIMLCYVMLWCPFNTPAIAVGVGGGGFHGIRSVGVGAQPLKQQSGAFRRWVHCACARRLATRRRSP
jgi:hypothetical protein